MCIRDRMRTMIGINDKGEMVVATIQGMTDSQGKFHKGLTVEQASQIMVEHFGCTYAMIMDSGRSTALLTSVGELPNMTVSAPSYLGAGTPPDGLNRDQLKQFLGPDEDNVYRNIAVFLAIKSKN